MKRTVSIFVLLVFAAAMSFAQASKDQYGVNKQGNQRITNGPVIESVSDHSAMIAWSTKDPAGSYIAYGTDPNKLDQKEAKPWGGTLHRLELKNLQPSTTYYFQVRSENAKGKGAQGADVESPVASFQTVAKGATPNRENRNVGVNGSASSRSGSSALPQSGQAGSSSMAQITDGPILESVSDDDAVIAWSTKQDDAQQSITYGTDKNNMSQMAKAIDKMGGTNHRVKLDNLKPTTTYYFHVVENGQSVSDVLEFQTVAKGQQRRQNVNLGVKHK